MPTLYLIPPSETKLLGGKRGSLSLMFDLPRPTVTPTATHLKLSGPRLASAQAANALIYSGEDLEVMPAIQRYTGVLYRALDYASLPPQAQARAHDSILIVSGMYGLLHPQDLIATYKLPMQTPTLKKHRQKHLTDTILAHAQGMTIVDLLPEVHSGLFERDRLLAAGISVQTKSFHGHFAKKEKGLRLRDQLSMDIQ